MTARLMPALFAACLVAVGAGAGAKGQTNEDARPAEAGVEAHYTFGVFPYLTPLRLEAIYAPIGKALGTAVGRPVKFRTATRFELFFAALKAEKFDIAFVQPIWTVRAADEIGYLPLARIEEPLTAMIIVLDDGPIRSLEDLRGKTIATPPPFGPVTRMATRALNERGLVPGRDVTLKGFKSVDSCFQQLAIGSASACISGHMVQREIEESLGIKLRVLLQTPGIPNLTFIVHPRVPAEDRARFLETILSWRNGDADNELPHRLGASRFVQAFDADYDAVRTMLKEPAPQ